jgi:hypothetical protein
MVLAQKHFPCIDRPPDFLAQSTKRKDAVKNNHAKPPEAGHSPVMSPIQLWPATGSG